MANEIGRLGLEPTGRGPTGGEMQIYQDPIEKVVGYGTAIFTFDAVNQVADGSIEASATPGTTNYTGVSLSYGAASTLTYHLVVIAESSCYWAKGDASGTLAAADRGLNANLVLSAGSATTKRSGHRIAESTKQTTNTLDVKLRNLAQVPGNDYGAGAVFEIVFNKYRGAPATAGV